MITCGGTLVLQHSTSSVYTAASSREKCLYTIPRQFLDRSNHLLDAPIFCWEYLRSVNPYYSLLTFKRYFHRLFSYGIVFIDFLTLILLYIYAAEFFSIGSHFFSRICNKSWAIIIDFLKTVLFITAFSVTFLYNVHIYLTQIVPSFYSINIFRYYKNIC